MATTENTILKKDRQNDYEGNVILLIKEGYPNNLVTFKNAGGFKWQDILTDKEIEKLYGVSYSTHPGFYY